MKKIILLAFITVFAALNGDREPGEKIEFEKCTAETDEARAETFQEVKTNCPIWCAQKGYSETEWEAGCEYLEPCVSGWGKGFIKGHMAKCYCKCFKK